MADARRSVPASAWFALGAALSLAALWPSPAGVAGVLLAQPAFALGFATWRGYRLPLPADRSALAAYAAIAVLWVAAGALLALATGWPLAALQETGSLAAALALSGLAGAVLLCLWRAWPAFGLSARTGGGTAQYAAAVGSSTPAEAGRGFVVAVAVAAVLGGALALAWPDLLPPGVRTAAALALLPLALVAHALVQRFGAAPAPPTLAALPIVGDEDADEPASPIAADLVDDPEARLYAAVRAGRVEAALAALEDGADPSLPPTPDDRDQRTLPMLAALLGDLRLLRELIARGIDLNAEHAGLTPLLAATRDSWHGRPEAVMTLLANGADARHADADGNTPLHHAARSTDPAVAALLLDAGALLEAINHEGFSPLGIACAAGNWRLARFLIERGARPEPKDGQPALLAAVVGDDDPAGVQLLLRHKARVDARGARQRTALLLACAAGNAEIVGELLDAGADRNARDADESSPLLEVARGGHAAALARLAQAKPDVAAVDALGRNALVLATEAGVPPEFLRHLIAMGVNPEQRDQDGRRALEHALGAGRWPLVAVLDPAYPLPASVAEGLSEGHFEKTPRELLREALLADRGGSAEAMIRLGAGPDATGMASLLLEFAGDGDLPRLEWLLRHGADPDERIDGDSVLFHLLARGGHAAAALQRLLEHGQPVGGRGGLARWLQACLDGDHATRGFEQLALALLERGADAFGAAVGDPPLGLAIRLGWLRLAEALLRRGVDPNARDARGHTALHCAATLGREGALRVLIRHGASPALAAPDGQTPLGLALAADRRELSHWLEWRQWQLPGRALQAADLPSAAMAGDAEAVLRLLELGLPVDGIDAQGCSALLRAAGGGHDVVVALLLEHGADTSLAARTGATPLSAAISMRHVGVVDRLLRAGARPDLPLPGDVTPLMLAAALGQPELISRLLACGADPQARDAQGLGALHCAALHAFSSRDRQRVLALMDVLLMADVAPDAPSAAGQTPLLLLLGARAEPGTACDEEVLLAALDRFLAEDVDLDAHDARGFTPLHLAAMHGLPRIVQRLLREGANRQARDSLGRTPHDIAVLRGFVDVAAEFEPARGAPSLARFLRDKN
jgi:hypothetical protein